MQSSNDGAETAATSHPSQSSQNHNNPSPTITITPSRITVTTPFRDPHPETTLSSLDPNSQEALVAMGRLYLTWCHAQPIILFDAELFLDSLPFRDKELVLALRSFGLRYPPGVLTPQQRQRIASTEREAKKLVMNRIADSDIQLSTLQTLCLLSLSEFAGQYHASQPTSSPLTLQQMAKLPRQD